MKTPITYYGGKQSMLNIILPMIPVHDAYNEPFFGGGAVFWAKEKVKNETINDKNDIVINFYQVLKKNFRQLKKEIDASLMSRTLHKKATSIIRTADHRQKVKLAWAFWYASNFSFACRLDSGIKYSNDQNTLPAAQIARKKAEFTELLVSRIENAQIENTCALKVIRSRNSTNMFHYVDPPYMNADNGHYKGYTEKDFENLLQLLEEVKGKFLFSNYPSDMLTSFIKVNNWNVSNIHFNNMPCHGSKMTKRSTSGRNEVLVWNYELPYLQTDLFNP